MAGANSLVNPSFDNGLTGWGTANPGAPNIITAQDGYARIVNAPGGNEPGLVQNIIVPGVDYLVEVSLSVLSGTFRIIIGNVIRVLPGSGYHRYLITGTAAPQFYLLQQTDGESQVFWASARRMDQSMSKIILTMRDFDGHKKDTSAMLGPVTDGASYVARKGEADALEAAINAVAGNVAHSSFLANDSAPNDANTVDVSYQTHYRWIVWFVDSVTGDGPYQFDIPTPKLSDNTLVVANSIEHDPAHADWIAFKAAFNGKVLNPKTSSTVNITRIFLEQ